MKGECTGGVQTWSAGPAYPFEVYAVGVSPTVWHVQGMGFNTLGIFNFPDAGEANTFALGIKEIYDETREKHNNIDVAYCMADWLRCYGHSYQFARGFSADCRTACTIARDATRLYSPRGEPRDDGSD